MYGNCCNPCNPCNPCNRCDPCSCPPCCGGRCGMNPCNCPRTCIPMCCCPPRLSLRQDLIPQSINIDEKKKKRCECANNKQKRPSESGDDSKKRPCAPCCECTPSRKCANTKCKAADEKTCEEKLAEERAAAAARKSKSLEESCADYLSIVHDNMIDTTKNLVSSSLKDFFQCTMEKIQSLSSQMVRTECLLSKMYLDLLDRFAQQNEKNMKQFQVLCHLLCENQNKAPTPSRVNIPVSCKNQPCCCSRVGGGGGGGSGGSIGSESGGSGVFNRNSLLKEQSKINSISRNISSLSAQGLSAGCKLCHMNSSECKCKKRYTPDSGVDSEMCHAKGSFKPCKDIYINRSTNSNLNNASAMKNNIGTPRISVPKTNNSDPNVFDLVKRIHVTSPYATTNTPNKPQTRCDAHPGSRDSIDSNTRKFFNDFDLASSPMKVQGSPRENKKKIIPKANNSDTDIRLSRLRMSNS